MDQGEQQVRGAEYPAHWEADVLLHDGRAARIRPVVPADAELVLAFYERVSHESKYMRFLSPRPNLNLRQSPNRPPTWTWPR